MTEGELCEEAYAACLHSSIYTEQRSTGFKYVQTVMRVARAKRSDTMTPEWGFKFTSAIYEGQSQGCLDTEKTCSLIPVENAKKKPEELKKESPKEFEKKSNKMKTGH